MAFKEEISCIDVVKFAVFVKQEMFKKAKKTFPLDVLFIKCYSLK